jgi:hypothetical protein
MATYPERKHEPDDVLLDSAAISHRFRHRHSFTNYKPSTERKTVSVGNGYPLRVAGRGSIKVKSLLANGVRTVVLHGVLHVPHLATNIVSLGTLQNEEATYHSSEAGLVVTLQENELLRATLSRSLYHINQLPIHPIRDTRSSAVSSGSWRSHKGHWRPNTNRKRAPQQEFCALTYTSPRFHNHTHERYARTTPYRLPRPYTGHTPYERMVLLVGHLSGPMPVPTWTGKAYALTAFEMGSRMGVGELLETETGTDEALKAIVLRLERESGRKLKKIHTDAGNAYLREAVDAFCTMNHILHDIQPGTEENGVAARTSSMYLQKVSKMLHTAKMDAPSSYWGEA